MTEAPRPEPPPEAVWVFPEEKSRRGRVWLWVILAVATLAVTAVVVVFAIPRGQPPLPTAGPTSKSPSPSASASPTSSIPTATPTPVSTATETPTDPQTEPQIGDPELSVFSDRVAPVLDDAATGLGLVDESGASEALLIIEQLQQDAERLSDAVAPSRIRDAWAEAVRKYAQQLNDLAAALGSGSGSPASIAASQKALGEVRALLSPR